MNVNDKSRVTPTVDFDKDGKQLGYLNVPYSHDDSAWGSIRMPVACIKNGSGPTILFTGGNHGDEYEGILALHKLSRELEAKEVQGRVLIVPALNLPAVRAGTRTSPIDGGNMNRVFPGDRNGTITWVIAHYVETELLPLTDIAVDIHSGGKTLNFIPSAIMHRLDDKAQEARTLQAVEAFGAPLGMVIVELDKDGMLDASVEDAGKPFVSTELGGAGTVTVESLEIAEIGVRNLLKHFELIEGTVVTRESRGLEPTRLMDVPSADCYVIAEEDGIVEPLVTLGDEIEAGQPVARVHFIEQPGREPNELTARHGGMVICRRTHAQASSGDVIAVMAEDLE